ncbi:sialic acid-binding Ig-like lectin 7 isoform X2 [Esox lucius]|uniref:sialic acid-binding Ig-like lectin 7 isoform X2 n=1 Tax=Esox lucius TaxID=8010 RepID=UPI0010BDDB38|nr:sialic acid-binding Ig-like lectin 7 isoform X2 [Esox lucius]
MWLLIWTLLLTESLCEEGGKPPVPDGYNINISPAEITVQTGLCAVISCTFTHPDNVQPKDALWLKCLDEGCTNKKEAIFSSEQSSNVKKDYRQRVSLLERDLSKKNCSMIINNINENDQGKYTFRIKTSKAAGYTYKDKVNITVTDLTQKPSVLIPALTEGETVSLTCIAPGFCSGRPPSITWRWRRPGDNTTEFPDNTTIQKIENLTNVNTTHLSTLTFTPSAEHNGINVTCQVTFNEKIKTEETVTLNVTLRPPVLSGSGCVVQAGVMTCVCICQGVPVPLIRWPVLNNITEYNLTTSVSGSSVTSTISLPVRNQTNNSVVCVCKHGGDNSKGTRAKLNITQEGTNKNQTEEVESEGIMAMLPNPNLLTAFGIGAAFSASICSIFLCLVGKCKRRKERIIKDSDCKHPGLNLETVTSGNQLMDTGLAVECDLTPLREEPKVGAENRAGHTPSGQKPIEVDYASINYSLLKKPTLEDAVKTNTTESEYAEIKKENNKEEKEEAEEGCGVSEEVEEERVGNDEKKEDDELVGERDEDTALYSNVKAIRGEM